jgi:hypothetical protein
MSAEPYATLDDEPVNQEVRQAALGKGGREAILSVIDRLQERGKSHNLLHQCRNTNPHGWLIRLQVEKHCSEIGPTTGLPRYWRVLEID